MVLKVTLIMALLLIHVMDHSNGQFQMRRLRSEYDSNLTIGVESNWNSFNSNICNAIDLKEQKMF